MSKPKNRYLSKEDALVHYTKRGNRRANYHVVQCNGRVTRSPTDEPLVLTCVTCMAQETSDIRDREEDDYFINCAWCSKRIRFVDSYSPGDAAICAECNKSVPR